MARAFQLFRFSRWLLHRMGMQGHLPLALVDDVQPVLPLWSDDDLENLYLREEHRFGAYQNSPAVAGQISYVALLNPASSGILAVVEAVKLVAPATGVVQYGCVHTPLLPAIPAAMTVLDSRRGDAGLASAVQACTLVAGSTAAPVGPASLPRNPVTTAWNELPGRGFVVDPGSYFVVQHTVNNVEFSATVLWRTVPMLPAETSLSTGP